MTSDGAAATPAMARGVTDALHLLAEDMGEERLATLVRDLAVIAEVGQPRSPWDL